MPDICRLAGANLIRVRSSIGLVEPGALRRAPSSRDVGSLSKQRHLAGLFPERSTLGHRPRASLASQYAPFAVGVSAAEGANLECRWFSPDRGYR